jgi:hypothetical protein
MLQSVLVLRHCAIAAAATACFSKITEVCKIVAGRCFRCRSFPLQGMGYCCRWG